MQTEQWVNSELGDQAFDFTGDALLDEWDRLHAGDREPAPSASSVATWVADTPRLVDDVQDQDPESLARRLQDAWRSYHRGDFARAACIGMQLGLLGSNVANKAAGIYAAHLEPDDARRKSIYQAIVARCDALIAVDDTWANGHYLRAFALGRYSQLTSIAKALAEGYGGKIKASLDATLEIEPEHAEAHTALGLYHAEIIDKIGTLVGGLTYGAKKESALVHFKRALELTPDSAIARTEYANGLLMLYGDKKVDEATELYVQASELAAVDAMTQLDINAAAAELE